MVRPRTPGNIGSAARALKNMGFSKLALVAPAIGPTHPEAVRLAVNAADILKKTKVFETIEEAARGIRFLVGTSRRTGKYRRDFVPLPELPQHLASHQKTGILFGPEERGLTNRELAHCHLVCTIPSSPDYPSLNLAQAVMVTAYELRKATSREAGGDSQASSHSPASQKPKKARRGESADDGRAASERGRLSVAREALPGSLLVTVDKIEGMYRHLEQMLDRIGFFPHKNAFHMMRTLRQLFARTGMTDREVRIIRGICRQVLWATKSGRDSE